MIVNPTLLFAVNHWFTPFEIIGWSALLLLSLLLLSIPGRRFSLSLATAVTSLIVVGYFFSEDSSHDASEILLRSFTIVVVWAVALAILRYKRATEEVKTQKERLNAIFQNAREGMVMTDQAGTILMVNDHTESLFGFTATELVGKKVEVLIPDSIKEKHISLRTRFMHEPSDRAMGEYLELTAQRKDGSTFPVEISLGTFKIKDEDFAIAFVVDITKRKETETNLRREKTFKQLYFDLAPIISLALDQQGRVQSLNKYGCKVLGFAESEILGKKWFDLALPPEEKSDVHDVFRQMMSGIKIGTHENNIKTRDGKTLLIKWKNEIIKDDTDNPIGTLSAGEDVTEIRKQEQTIIRNLEKIKALNENLEERVKDRTATLAATLEELEAANNELQAEITQRKRMEGKLEDSQKLYHIMAHNFPNGLIGILNRDLRYILVDGSELESLGLSHDSLMGQRIFDDLYPIVSASSEEFLLRAFQGESLDFEVTLRDIPYRITAVPLPNSQDEIDQIMVVVRNMSDIKKVEEDLRRNLEKERELSELKSRFVTMASHEFRTPLSTILSSVFLLEKYQGEELNEKKAKHLNRIRQTIYNLTEILNDFLSLGKLEEGKMRLKLEEFNLADFVNHLLGEMSEVKKPGQQLLYKHNGESMVNLDKMVFRNIVINLVYNAIKYSPAHKRIEIETDLSGSLFLLSVRDEGIGIPDEAQPHIFKRFYRASNAGDVQGTGLGLHLVKKYSELMDGHIEFESKEGVGTLFKITFNLEPVEEKFHMSYNFQT